MKLISILTLTAVSFLANAQVKESSYKISRTFNLEGNGSWDLLTVDEVNERLFVSHNTMVQVVDLKDGKQIGVIGETKGVHGIAFALDLNKGFTSNGKDSSVTVFDLKSFKTILKVKVTGAKPDAILYDKFSQKVFVFNGKSANATVIDAKTNKVVATIVLEGTPELSVSDEKGRVYVNIETKNSIAVINATTLKIEQMWRVNPGEEPTAIAINNKTNRLYSVCGNKLMVIIDTKNGKLITTLPIGDHCDGVVFDPIKKRIFTSNGEGSITVVQEENENSYKIIETIKTQKGAKTIAINTVTNRLFLPVGEFGDTPTPTKEEPKPKPAIKPNTFKVIEIESVK